MTIFKNRYDNKTHRRLNIDTWEQFVDIFYKMAKRPLGGKEDAELISPAIYENGTTRSNKNVIGWAGWAAVDVDDFEINGNINDVINNMCGSYSYICYSTASSKSNQPKFRLVFRLSRNLEQEDIKPFWFALNSFLDSAGDRQTKDLSRMYYVPATYSGSYNFIFTGGSDTIDVDYLIARFPFIEKKHNNKSFLENLPDAWKEQIIEYRKSQLENTDIRWNGYQDCPFWPRKLATEYMTISSTGWYTKMYQIMVAIAGNAIKNKYPITPQQIATLCKQFDTDTGNWYENRPLETEANNALEYAYRNS